MHINLDAVFWVAALEVLQEHLRGAHSVFARDNRVVSLDKRGPNRVQAQQLGLHGVEPTKRHAEAIHRRARWARQIHVVVPPVRRAVWPPDSRCRAQNACTSPHSSTQRPLVAKLVIIIATAVVILDKVFGLIFAFALAQLGVHQARIALRPSLQCVDDAVVKPWCPNHTHTCTYTHPHIYPHIHPHIHPHTHSHTPTPTPTRVRSLWIFGGALRTHESHLMLSG